MKKGQSERTDMRKISATHDDEFLPSQSAGIFYLLDASDDRSLSPGFLRLVTGNDRE